MKISSVNPFSEKVNAEFHTFTLEQCDEVIQKARAAFPSWKSAPVLDRSEHIKHAASNLRKNRVRFAEIITREMGKPITQAVSEVEKCAMLCDYYAENASSILQDEIIRTEAKKSYVRFEPLGVILGIMPWNFPFWQVFRFAIPAMAAGNVCLLKHASNVPITALEIHKLFQDAGFPPEVFQTLLIDGSAAKSLVERDLVDGVSLTGSVEAGSQIGSASGKLLKKLVLELGGSDPFIVLDDADMERAAEAAVKSRIVNSGQSCVAAKRFIVMDKAYEAFREAFMKNLNGLKVGNPMEEDTDIGPLAKKEFADALKEQLEDAQSKGGVISYGPKPPEGTGFFFRPALVTNVRPDMKVLTEEVFGPVAPIIPAKNEEEIIAIANATPFGLGASIWSRNTARAEDLSRHIEAGFVAINDMVKSDPRLPFGGIKKSGVGRELSHYGTKEFVNVKTIVLMSA